MARSDEHAARHANMVDRSVGEALRDYLVQTFAVAAAEVQKLYHDPLELFTRAVQPVLWLLLFGEVMAQVRGVSPGNLPYLDFLSAGILAQSVLFVAIFYGISAIWERDLGVLQRYLVSPAARSALVAGMAPRTWRLPPCYMTLSRIRAGSHAFQTSVTASAIELPISCAPARIPSSTRRPASTRKIGTPAKRATLNTSAWLAKKLFWYLFPTRSTTLGRFSATFVKLKSGKRCGVDLGTPRKIRFGITASSRRHS